MMKTQVPLFCVLTQNGRGTTASGLNDKSISSISSLYMKLPQGYVLPLWAKVKLFSVRIGGQSSTSTGMIYAMER